MSIARRTLLRDSSSVLPCSRVHGAGDVVEVLLEQLLELEQRLQPVHRRRLRATPGYAFSAACTARSTSAAPPSGTRPSTSSFAGLRTSPKRVASESTQRPPMYRRRVCAVAVAPPFTAVAPARREVRS